MIIDGKSIAAEILDDVRLTIASRAQFAPGLAVVIVGNDPASRIYVSRKVSAAQEVGINSFVRDLPHDIDQATLSAVIQELNADARVHGILVQLPLPTHINASAVLNAINPTKDVDGFTDINVGKLAKNDQSGLFPCTPSGCMHLLRSAGLALSGAKVAVIGRSQVVGRPLAIMLINAGCTVTLVSRKTPDPQNLVRNHDALVSATGVPGLITEDWVNDRMVVLDVGITRAQGKISGDVDFDNVSQCVRAITPVPGGVGPMTIAYLLKNTLKAAGQQ